MSGWIRLRVLRRGSGLRERGVCEHGRQTRGEVTWDA